MGTVQNEKNQIYFVKNQKFINQLIFTGIENLQESFLDVKNELEEMKQNQVFWEEGEQNGRFYPGNERKKLETSANKVQGQSGWQECQEIVKRAVEILADWEEMEDIRFQVQYAAILVGKIDRLKETETVATDDVRRKICTLLRNVIRLNAAEEQFSQEQIQILKTGFSMITVEKVQKQDLLQLNRKMLKEGLQTMPAWEESGQEVQKLINSGKVSEKIREILCAAQNDEKAYRGNNCKTLGDTVISLETLKSKWKLGVCTSNRQDFEPICEAIGLELATPDYSRKQ